MNDKPKTSRQLIAAFNKDMKDQAIRALLAADFGDIACFVIADSKIDADDTIDNRSFINDTGQEVNGAMTFADVLKELAPQYEADPITGRALRKGMTTDKPRVDWGRVSKKLREVVAYAVETQQLPPGSTSEMVVDAILHDPLRAPWNRLSDEWQTLCESKKPADQVRALAIRTRLVYDTGDKATVTTKKTTVNDPELQKLLDLNLPKVPDIAPDDPRRQGGTFRKDYLQMEDWGCMLTTEQYRAVVIWIIAPSPLWGALFHGGRSGQARVLYDFLQGRYTERMQTLLDHLK